MRLVSFNINSVRARIHQMDGMCATLSPDVVGLQETKVIDDLFPHGDLEQLGMQIEVHGQKGHYGVALLSTTEMYDVEVSMFGEEDEKRRFICATVEDPELGEIRVMNGYFPQGENRAHPTKFPEKERFYKGLMERLEDYDSEVDKVVIMGDMNISPQDCDIGIGDHNRKRWLQTGKCSFLPEEREWYDRLMDWGLTDTYRHMHGQSTDKFSWFDYRSKGFDDSPRRGLRIDHILVSDALKDHIVGADIDYQTRGMEKPSDHAPVWVDLG